MRDPSAIPQMLISVSIPSPTFYIRNLHGIDGPEDQGEACDGNEKCSGFLILVLNNTTSVDGKLVDDDQISNASHGIPSPLRAFIDGNSSEETSQHHDDVSDDSDEDVGTTESGEEGEVQKQEWGGQAPVNVTGPIDLAVDIGEGIREVLLGVLDGDDILRDTSLDGHSVVRNRGEGSNESGQNVEQAFLLRHVSRTYLLQRLELLTTGTRKAKT